MYKVNFCLACHSSDIELKQSKLARFVVWRATQDPVDDNIDNYGIVCNNCSYIGSQLRLTDKEVNNLYKNYRGDDYNELRIICEPNYKDRANSFSEEEYTKTRAVGINKLISNNIDVSKVSSVLDFGGDTGFYIPNVFTNAKKYVYDISGVELLPGIESYNEQVGAVDFVMCCHLLEHMSDPDVALIDIKKLVSKDSWAYFEVPNNPTPYLPTRFHEHINIFNKKSFIALLERNGFSIIDTDETHHLCVLTKLK